MSHKTFNDPHGVSDAARQGLLDNRCEGKPKRHRTLGRRKRLSKEKRQRVKAKVEAAKRARSRFLKAARAYWRGEADVHPS